MTTSAFSGDAFSADMSREAALRRLRSLFRIASLAEPDSDARLLLEDALRIDAVALIRDGEAPIGSDGAARLGAYAARRLAREPVWRILGEREFYGLPFALSSETLVPRPDTETLVDLVRDLVREESGDTFQGDGLEILDLGTGTGCILIALLALFPRARGVGIDRSAQALVTARGNAIRNGVAERASFAASDWLDAVGGRFDVIVSNPPYIPGHAIAELDEEVRVHDPRAALDGGTDGLGPYRRIFETSHPRLRAGGFIVVEIGANQESDVDAIAQNRGWKQLASRRDLPGIVRAVAYAVT